MPKTLIITLEYPPQIGGVSSYVYNLAAHLPAGDVVVYAPKIKGDKEFDSTCPWKTYRYSPYWPIFIWPRWTRLIWQINRLIKKEKIERIFVHHALPVGYATYFISRLKHVPYSLFFHGTDVEMGTNNHFKLAKLRRVCARAQAIFTNSQFLKNKLEERLELGNRASIVYSCPGNNFLVPSSEVDKEQLVSRLALGGKKVILTVARMAEGKGYPHLIRLLPKILEKVPNLVWLIIGDGPKKEEVIKLTQRYNLQNVARFLGNIPHKDLPVYYQIADLFVLLTHKDEETEEGLGTVFLEAAASGVPVVGGRVGGVEEVVKNLETGILVDTFGDVSVIAAITNLLLEKENAKQMGLAGRTMVQKEFTWEEQVAKINLALTPQS